ncbi:DMT family transporter [Cellulosilyticum sp. I15G10I2]|uniref:DMT family transporter n=1 Tax=Cellulosilyticum sp. I15G10I2 TaxID=1892843 RepID=UPI00085BE4D9|nr:DMT family transporter [Cellulosilyticum sp. I15G10I2]
MLISSLTAIASGILMSIQGVWNTRVTEKAGMWLTNSIVHAVGFVFCLCVLFFTRDAHLEGLRVVNKLYLLGGVLGAGIVYTVVVSIGRLGPAYAIMIILVAQTFASYLIELFGLFDTEKVPFMWTKLVGVGIMVIGIIVFQWKN